MGNSSKVTRIFLVVLLVLIVALIMYYVSISPFMTQSAQLDAQIASVESELAEVSAKIQGVEPARNRLADIETNLEQLENGMPQFPDYALYLSDFQDLTKNASETRIAFSDGTTTSSGKYTMTRSNISFDCTYGEMKEILDGLLEKHAAASELRLGFQGIQDDGNGNSTSVVSVSFIADYLSRTGSYANPGNYTFISGQYGLSDLFAGISEGERAAVYDRNQDAQTEAQDEQVEEAEEEVEEAA